MGVTSVVAVTTAHTASTAPGDQLGTFDERGENSCRTFVLRGPGAWEWLRFVAVTTARTARRLLLVISSESEFLGGGWIVGELSIHRVSGGGTGQRVLRLGHEL